MSKLPPVASGEWWNHVGLTAIEQGFDIFRQMVDATMASGYPPTGQPVTLKSLMEKDPAQVGVQLEGMIRNPLTSRQGVELLRKYMDAMSKKQEPEPSLTAPQMEVPDGIAG